MALRDAVRFLGLTFVLALVEIPLVLLFKDEPRPFEHLAAFAAFVTVLWAIREGQGNA